MFGTMGEAFRSHRLTVRTPGSHPGNPGSIPGEITKKSGASLDGLFFLVLFMFLASGLSYTTNMAIDHFKKRQLLSGQVDWNFNLIFAGDEAVVNMVHAYEPIS